MDRYWDRTAVELGLRPSGIMTAFPQHLSNFDDDISGRMIKIIALLLYNPVNIALIQFSQTLGTPSRS